jgi:hypothetical protein
MGYDATGNYTRTHNFSADGSAGIKILASRMDAEFNDFASAMSLQILKDGRNAATANLPMGGFRHVNVGAPASATNYMRGKDFIENVPIYVVDAEASADRISVSASFYTTASAATAPRDGSHLLIKAGSDKSSAVAIRLNTGDGSPHSAGVVLANGSSIYSGAIRSGGIYEFIWSSSDAAWQLFNPQVDYASSAYPGVALLATAAEVAAGTDVPKIVTPAQLASKFSASYATTASAGLVELATTAEISIGVNISAVITPSVLHTYVSAATTASAGMLEIATTAEASVGTDASRAITPSTLRAVRSEKSFGVVISLTSGVSTAAFIYRTEGASACTASVKNTGARHVRVIHNMGLASGHAAVIGLQMYSDVASTRLSYKPVMWDASTDSFAFDFAAFTTASGPQFLDPASCAIHIQVLR